MELGDFGNWATIGSFLLSILAIAGFALRWTIKHYLAELKPNHGSSLRDKITDIHDDIEQLAKGLKQLSLDVARLAGRFDQHIEENKE